MVINLVVFNVQACISAALQHLKEAQIALNDIAYPEEGLARSLNNARQSLEEGWHDMQMASFANTGIKHSMIAMVDIGTRAVHAIYIPSGCKP